MQKLRDGTVVPSVLNVGSAPNADTMSNLNIGIKEGIVTAILYPTDIGNVSKKEIEYNVAVAEYSHRMNTNLSIYRNCRISNLFGTVNNYLRYTLQPSSQNPEQVATQTNDLVFKDGARVLLLCISGVSRASSAVIIGGVQHRDATIPSSTDGQFYDFNFNGIQQLINDDGELIITFNSPTDQAGNQDNAAAAGTQIKLDKSGHVTISDNLGQQVVIDRDAQQISIKNGSESMVIDKQAKSVTVTSGKDENLNAGGNLNTTSGGDTSVSSGGALNLKSSGQTSMSSGGSTQVKSGGQWQLTAQGNVQVTSQGEVMVTAASGPVIQSQGPMVLVGEGSVPAATVGTSICQGIGNLGLPVISTIITGSFTVFVGT